MVILPHMYVALTKGEEDIESTTSSTDEAIVDHTSDAELESNVATVKKIYFCVGVLFGVRL